MNKTHFQLNLVRGMIIGLANIIPGVSGGTMMVAMGIYDQLIHSITHLLKEFKKSIRFLLPIFIGVAVAIVLLAKLFDFLLVHAPIATNLAFCGLILGSVPPIVQNVKHKGFNFTYGIAFFAFFAIVVLGALFSNASGPDAKLTVSFGGLAMLFLVGVIAAATMVIPGVSGSMMLMLMGYYQPVISLVSTAVDSLIHFDFPALLNCIILGIPFGLGVIVGIYAIAKLIEWVLKNYQLHTYWAILGLIIASPIAIMIQTNWSVSSLWQIAVGSVAFIACFFVPKLIERLEP